MRERPVSEAIMRRPSSVCVFVTVYTGLLLPSSSPPPPYFSPDPLPLTPLITGGKVPREGKLASVIDIIKTDLTLFSILYTRSVVFLLLTWPGTSYSSHLLQVFSSSSSAHFLFLPPRPLFFLLLT